MIPSETWYKTHDGEFFAIVKVFKIWRHYLEDCKHKVFVPTNYNNLCRFRDTKSLSFCQVWWAQKLSHYYFSINYCPRKANGAADALSHFLQQDNEEKANFRAENTQILHCLQFLLTNVSISELYATVSSLSPQHQFLICRIYALPQLRHFWITLQIELVNEEPYKASISSMKLKLQKANSEAQELRQQKADGYEKINEIFHHQSLPFVPKAIQTELISHYHDNPLVGHFGIKKICKLSAQKYYWLTLRHDIEAYMKGCNVCLASKAVRYKPYNDLQLLPVPMH